MKLKKEETQTDMEKGIKVRSAFQSRHNLGHCKNSDQTYSDKEYARKE